MILFPAVYASAPNLGQMNHAVAETDEDVQSLLVGASEADRTDAFVSASDAARRFVSPVSEKENESRQADTLMSMGFYEEPRGALFPSVLY